jgi:hypothetical protein
MVKEILQVYVRVFIQQRVQPLRVPRLVRLERLVLRKEMWPLNPRALRYWPLLAMVSSLAGL